MAPLNTLFPCENRYIVHEMNLLPHVRKLSHRSCHCQRNKGDGRSFQLPNSDYAVFFPESSIWVWKNGLWCFGCFAPGRFAAHSGEYDSSFHVRYDPSNERMTLEDELHSHLRLRDTVREVARPVRLELSRIYRDIPISPSPRIANR